MKYDLLKIQEEFEKKQSLEFLFFWGHQPCKDGTIGKGCFSQWFPAKFIENDIEYQNAEQYMMAGKARLFKDEKILKEILETNDPKQVKLLGRKINNFSALIWDEFKYEIVKQGNFLKFSQNEDFKEYILSTEDKILVEASPYDRIWGIWMLESDSKIENPLFWKGENLLGFALMEVRDILSKN